MKACSFTNLTVRPFPNATDLDNPWIFGGVQVIINVSGHDCPDEIKQMLSAKGIERYWFPLVEEGPDMGLDNIIKAVCVLQECDQENRKVVLHCTCGNNRSRTVAEVFHYVRTGDQIEDEYKGYANHLLFNIDAAPGQKFAENLPGVADNIVSGQIFGIFLPNTAFPPDVSLSKWELLKWSSRTFRASVTAPQRSSS